MILYVVVDLDRSVTAKIIYVISIVVPLRFVKTVRHVLVLAKIVDTAPILSPIGLELG
jgi:hypothetical protein